MSTRPVIVIGAGGHGEVVAATVVAAGHTVSAYYDDDAKLWGQRIGGIEVVGSISEATESSGSAAVIGIGDNRTRKRVAEQLDLDWVTVVHPFAWVAPGVPVGPGTVICAGSIVQPGAKIGSHVILNTKASVDHHVEIGDYVHVAVAHLAGNAAAEEGAFLALGSTVLPGLRVGAWATVGAGALVSRKDVRPESVVVGAPAREVALSGSKRAEGAAEKAA